MKHVVMLAGPVLVIAAAAVWTWQTAADVGSSGLPGARAEIDAARFPSLQAALDALPAEGGLVRLPPGLFQIDRPLLIQRQDVLLVGAGPATHIQNVNTEGQPALVLQHPDGRDVRPADRLWRIQLAKFRISGNEGSGHGIEAIQIQELFIDGVSVSHHGGDGIRLDHCYEDPRICNSLITYNKHTGLNLIGCHDIVVVGNQFEENHDALRCADGFNLCMTGNCLDDHLGDGVVIENTYGSVVSGNMIEECRGTAIVLDRDCYGITLSANVIAHNGGGIDLRDAHGCTVSANTLTIMHSDAVKVGPGSGRITVTGNNFANSYIGLGQVRRGTGDLNAAGLVLEGTSDVAIAGNLFAAVKPKALELRDPPARRVVFSGNVVTDADSDHAQLRDSVVETNLAPEPK